MATRLFLRQTTGNGIGSFKDAITTAGVVNSGNNIVTETTAGGTKIQFTPTAGGAVLEWISGRAPGGGFTLSGDLTAAVGAREASSSTNVGMLIEVHKRTLAGVGTLVASSYYPSGTATELDQATTLKSWTAFTPTSTFMEEDSRLVTRIYAINVGTMGASASGLTGRYDGPDTTAGGAYLQITENITFKSEAEPNGIIVAVAGFDQVQITERQPTVVVDLNSSPAPDSVAVSEFAPTVTVIDNYNVSPAPDSVAFTGFAPTVVVVNTSAPGVDSVAITGFAPVVTQSTESSPGPDSVLLTGYAPVVASGVVVDVDEGTYIALGTFPVTVSISYGVTPDPDTVAITGFAPTVIEGMFAAPGADSVVITGFAPAVTAGAGIHPGADSVVVTGFAPVVASGVAAAPGFDTIAITGFAPAVGSNVAAITPAPDSVVITEYAPTVTIIADTTLIPGTAAIVVTGFAPVVGAGIEVAPGLDALAITEFAPSVFVSEPLALSPTDLLDFLAATAQSALNSSKEFPPVPPARSDMLGAVDKLRELTDILVGRRGAGQSAAVLRRMVQGFVVGDGPLQLTQHTVDKLPSPSPAGRMVYISNEAGGPVPAFSDGLHWRRVTDRNVVS